MQTKYPIILSFLLSVSFASVSASNVLFNIDQQSSELAFGIAKLSEVLVKNGCEVVDAGVYDYKLRFVSYELGTGSQSYRTVWENDKSLRITYGDNVGAMYAALDIAEQLELGSDLSAILERSHKPYIVRRGLKFNIPFDGRTPSYDDTGDAAQLNVETMWDFHFWKHFLNSMAANRYNVLTLWTTNPYAGIVELPKYPDVNFDNVAKLTIPITAHIHNHFEHADLFDPNNHEIILEVSLEEKIEFWTKVFNYAESLGIEIYVFHWNIFAWGAEGKYGITKHQDNPKTIAYQRYCIEQFLKTYPQIDGIGVSAGERVNRKKDWSIGIEDWLFETYGKGVLDVLEADPDRKIRFIFRHLWSDLEKSADAFEGYDVPFNTSHKYARARIYGTTASPYFDKEYREKVEKTGIPCWLNLRNDDLFLHRWGNAQYVREFLNNVPRDVLKSEAGFYMGPDSYVWGKEFVAKNSELSGQWEIDKHWYRFMLWGRLGYDPAIPHEYFVKRLNHKYPEVEAVLLEKTWAYSSQIIYWIDQFFFRVNDDQFAPEGCIYSPKRYGGDGFLTLDKSFFAHPPLIGSGILSVQEYAEQYLNGEGFSGMTPLDVSSRIHSILQKTLSGISKLRAKRIESAELCATISDMESMAYLGQFYAHRIEAAALLAIYRQDPSQKQMHQQAICSLESCVDAWEKYSEVASSQSKAQLLARTGDLDWNWIFEKIQEEINLIKEE